MRAWHAANDAVVESYVWKSIGPLPLHGYSYDENGRITAIVVSPLDRNIIVAGTSSGGIWRSTDGGSTFVPVSDDQADITVGAIAIAPSNPNVLYAGMGEDHLGTGVLKSIDGGATWRRVTTAAFAPRGATAKIVVDPRNADIVWLAQKRALDPNMNLTGSVALLKSTDGGVTWREVFKGLVDDLLMLSDDGSTLVAGAVRMSVPGTGGIYRTTDSGATWQLAFPQSSEPDIPPHYYMAKAGRTLYAAEITDRRDILISTDDGAHWMKHVDAPRDIVPLYLAASPHDGTLFYGAVGLYRSTDAGLTWQSFGETVIHLDHHAIAFDPVDRNRVWFGNDGGLWVSNDGGVTMKSLAGKISSMQFYAIGAHPTDPSIIVGGSQDNGSQRRDAKGEWHEVISGDGGWPVFDAATSRVLTSSNGGIFRTEQNGAGQLTAVVQRFSTVFGDGFRVRFIPQIVRGNDGTVWFPTYRLFASRDFGSTWNPPGGMLDLTNGGNDYVFTLAVSDSDPRTLYTASAQGRIMVTRDAAVTWSDVTPATPRPVTSIAIDREFPDIAYLALNGYGAQRLMKTTNAGRTWSDASTGLPNVPVDAIYIDRRSNSTLYAGTDVGAFRSRNGGGEWAPFDAGMPPVIVTSFTTTADGRLLAGTYGRGAYELHELAPPPSDSRRRSVRH